MAKKQIATNAQNIEYSRPGAGAEGYGYDINNVAAAMEKLWPHRNEEKGGSSDIWQAMIKNNDRGLLRSPNSTSGKAFKTYLDTGKMPASITPNFLQHSLDTLDFGIRSAGHDQQNKSNFLDSTFGKILTTIATVAAGVVSGGTYWGVALGAAIGGVAAAASTRPSGLGLAAGVIGGASGASAGGGLATGITKAGGVANYASNAAAGVGNFIQHPITGIANALGSGSGAAGATAVGATGVDRLLGAAAGATGPVLGAGSAAAPVAASGFGSIIGSILNAGSTIAPIVGSIIGANAANKAAKIQAQAASNAADLQLTATRETIQAQKEATAIARGDVQPWRLAGEKGLNLQQQLLGINPYSGMKPDDMKTWLASKGLDPSQTGYSSIRKDALQKQYQGYAAARSASIAKSAAGATAMTPEKIMALDPGYQFRLDQGNKAIDASSAALRGPGLSGATLKELTRYGSDYASNEFGNIYSRASNLSGQGLGAATGQANFTQAGANNVGEATMTGAARAGEFGTQAANAHAAGTVASGNAIGGAINNIGQQIYLRQLLNPQP